MVVSLCMIAYNEAEAIQGLFSDISLQDYPHEKIEIVFVDSMSTDSTYERMEKFKNTDYGFMDVRIVQCAKRNQAFSWNAALMTATGDVIIRVDAHARIPRNFVSRNVYNLKQGENVVGGGRPNISSNVSSWKMTLLAAEDSLFGSSVAAYRRPSTQKEYMDSLFHAAYRRKVIATVGGFNENLGRTEDNEFHYRIRQAGFKMCCCPDIISYQHSRNTLKNMVRQKYSNGRWIGLTVSECPGCLSYFHFVPSSVCYDAYRADNSRDFRASLPALYPLDNLRNVRFRKHGRLLHGKKYAASVCAFAVYFPVASRGVRRGYNCRTASNSVLAQKNP